MNYMYKILQSAYLICLVFGYADTNAESNKHTSFDNIVSDNQPTNDTRNRSGRRSQITDIELEMNNLHNLTKNLQFVYSKRIVLSFKNFQIITTIHQELLSILNILFTHMPVSIIETIGKKIDTMPTSANLFSKFTIQCQEHIAPYIADSLEQSKAYYQDGAIKVFTSLVTNLLRNIKIQDIHIVTTYPLSIFQKTQMSIGLSTLPYRNIFMNHMSQYGCLHLSNWHTKGFVRIQIGIIDCSINTGFVKTAIEKLFKKNPHEIIGKPLIMNVSICKTMRCLETGILFQAIDDIKNIMFKKISMQFSQRIKVSLSKIAPGQKDTKLYQIEFNALLWTNFFIVDQIYLLAYSKPLSYNQFKIFKQLFSDTQAVVEKVYDKLGLYLISQKFIFIIYLDGTFNLVLKYT